MVQARNRNIGARVTFLIIPTYRVLQYAPEQFSQKFSSRLVLFFGSDNPKP